MLAGYTGDSLSLKTIIAFLIGLSLYNALELIILIFVTFNKYQGVYFWSLIIAGIGVIPYSLGFLIKFFQLLDPAQNQGYVAVVFLTVGWYMMVTGMSISHIHLPRFPHGHVSISSTLERPWNLGTWIPLVGLVLILNQANPSSSGPASTSSPTPAAS